MLRRFLAATACLPRGVPYESPRARLDHPPSPQANPWLSALHQSPRLQLREDEAAVIDVARKAKDLLGEKAGDPNEPEDFRKAPREVNRLSPQEIALAFAPYYRYTIEKKWWQIGEDPTRADHALRD